MTLPPKAFGILGLAIVTGTTLLLSSCEAPMHYRGPGYIAGNGGPMGNRFGRGPSADETSSYMQTDTVSYWNGDGVQGQPGITIDLSQQRAYFYKGSELVGVSLISSGSNKYPTPTGDFKITQKNKDHESNLYGDYKYPDGSIAQKDVDTSKDPQPPGTVYDGADMPYFMRFNGGIGMHGGYLPGYPASHGCIRMPIEMAKIYFNNVKSGTPVRVIH
jgi:lipoprotein-anchoring transpeptidase ErfK/SrfK